jgi:type I restriction enzyme S subunit
MDPEINIKFVYYYLASKTATLHELAKTKSVKMPQLSVGDIDSLDIPAPPRHLQDEIVQILDTFTALEAELEAELDARKKQFCELRNTLILGETESCDWFTLTDIAEEFGRGKSRHRPRNDPKLYGGPYPFIQTGDVRSSGHFITKFSQTYTDAGLDQSKLWPAGTICITIAANIAETGVLTFDACFPDSVLGLRVNSKIASPHYVEYMLQALRNSLVEKGQGSAQANINLSTFENHRFPFPNLERQIQIVEILNSLDTLIHSESEGIPVELAARRKQYEYYRDQLLSFQEA